MENKEKSVDINMSVKYIGPGVILFSQKIGKSKPVTVIITASDLKQITKAINESKVYEYPQ